ncbi:MAG TPA: glycosyltransferase [Verrucomicrobia bacterium]|nr:glycosyltransferase [Verrucomicrobiales bacterium]HIL54825.1 glycosyltransferase [Verrucomicrobiota bacterium]
MNSILLVGQTPPPYHGQAIAMQQLFDQRWEGLKIRYLRMAYSHSESEVGRFRIRKIFHLISLVIKSWFILIKNRPCCLYYPPASPNRTPVIRDVVFLLLVRPLAKDTIFHYHAGGLPEYVASLSSPLRFLSKIAFSNATLGIEISESQLNKDIFFPVKKRICISNGLDVSDVEQRFDEEEDGRRRILFIAGLRESKGVMDIIGTADKMRQLGADFVFDVAGAWQEENTRREFETELSRLNLNDHIILHGRVTGEEKWELYRQAYVFFFPSFYESENFPLVLIEAMAFGLPIVATNWRGIPELVAEGETGRLCDVQSCEQFSSALNELINNEDQHEEMASLARSRYEKKYTKAAFISAMRKAFESVIDEPKIQTDA